MELTGHSGEVFAVRFDQNGQHLASGSMDRSISEFRFVVESSILTTGSALEYLWSVRELWRFKRSQGRSA
jgi:WD40 repeat protein